MKRLLAALLALTVLLCLPGCGGEKAAEAVPETIQEFATARIGTTTGSIQCALVPEILPEAELVEFNTLTDAVMALTSGKVDAVATEDAVCMAMRREGQPLRRVAEPMGTSPYGILFGKGTDPRLKEEFNAFLADSKADGSLEQLEQKWFGEQTPVDTPDYSDLTGRENVIRFAVDSADYLAYGAKPCHPSTLGNEVWIHYNENDPADCFVASDARFKSGLISTLVTALLGIAFLFLELS